MLVASNVVAARVPCIASEHDADSGFGSSSGLTHDPPRDMAEAWPTLLSRHRKMWRSIAATAVVLRPRTEKGHAGACGHGIVRSGHHRACSMRTTSAITCSIPPAKVDPTITLPASLLTSGKTHHPSHPANAAMCATTDRGSAAWRGTTAATCGPSVLEARPGSSAGAASCVAVSLA